MTPQVERVWSPGRHVPMLAILKPLWRGGGDPCFRVDNDTIWRATLTPEGSALLHLAPAPGEAIHARAWGDGAQWVIDGVPELFGDHYDPSGFRPLPEHRVLVEAHRRFSSWRPPRTKAVFEAFSAACLEQVVTGPEAFHGWRTLVQKFGTTAPGPAHDPTSRAAGMMCPPTPLQWRAISDSVWLSAGVELRRRRVVQTGARVAPALERTLTTDPATVEAALRSLPGVGVWTAAEVRSRAHGDADAFSFADYHVAKDVTWALTGEVLDDDACAEIIEPYRGHRLWVQRLIELANLRRPRRGPRLTIRTHMPGGVRRYPRVQ